MNLFELFVKIGVKDEASGNLKSIGQKLGNGLKTAAKVGTAAVGAAAAGIAALTKSSIDSYAEYEQLVGGIETLFEDLSWDVGQNAAKAFQTAGLSANEYMSTAMSFAASLNQSLQEMDGNIARSAYLTDQAILDMADNANKMGSDMSTLQTAYAGFAKQNYTLLDNLKIGYGGTKEEMQRLIADAAELSDTVDAQSMSFANIVEAIHVVQTEMGITGTTAKEAGQTISGSVGAMKSAWQNLLTGLADGNADIGKLVDDLVVTIVGDGTENNLGVIGNILPAVERALNGAGKLIDELVPIIIDKIPEFIEKYLPKILEAGVSIVLEIALGLVKAIPSLVKTIPQIINNIIDVFKSKSGEFSSIGKNIIDGIKKGISNAWKNLKTWFKNLFGDLIGIAKKILGIASPSKVFKKIGGFTAEGFGVGFEDEFAHVKDDMKKALTFEEASIGINASVKRTGAGQGAFGSNAGGVSIVQNIYSEAKTAADLMQEALYHQERAVLLGV